MPGKGKYEDVGWDLTRDTASELGMNGQVPLVCLAGMRAKELEQQNHCFPLRNLFLDLAQVDGRSPITPGARALMTFAN